MYFDVYEHIYLLIHGGKFPIQERSAIDSTKRIVDYDLYQDLNCIFQIGRPSKCPRLDSVWWRWRGSFAQDAFVADSGIVSRCTQACRMRIKEAFRIVHALHAPSPALHGCSWAHRVTARGWRRGVQRMHDPKGLFDARLASLRAPAWVAAVGDEGILSDASYNRNQTDAKLSRPPHG